MAAANRVECGVGSRAKAPAGPFLKSGLLQRDVSSGGRKGSDRPLRLILSHGRHEAWHGSAIRAEARDPEASERYQPADDA